MSDLQEPLLGQAAQEPEEWPTASGKEVAPKMTVQFTPDSEVVGQRHFWGKAAGHQLAVIEAYGLTYGYG
jgi:hypothetical protein